MIIFFELSCSAAIKLRLCHSLVRWEIISAFTEAGIGAKAVCKEWENSGIYARCFKPLAAIIILICSTAFSNRCFQFPFISIMSIL